MTGQERNFPSGFDRLNGLMEWWGMPSTLGSGELETRTKRFQNLVAELNNVVSDILSRQIEAMFTANERFSRSLQELLRTRDPQEMMTAHSKIAVGLLEDLVAQTKTWAELTQKMHGCCAAVAREIVDTEAEEPGKAARSGPRLAAEKPAGNATTARAARN